MVAHNTGSTVTCSVIKLAYYNLKLYELEIYDLIVAKVALKVYRYRYRHRGKSLFTYRLLTELKIPLPYISVGICNSAQCDNSFNKELNGSVFIGLSDT